MFSPRRGEVHVSCVFTWDKPKAESIAGDWRQRGCSVKVGGPAYDDPGGVFVPGRYLLEGHTITSRGCPKKCPWCYVPGREGDIRLLPIQAGNIIQDNNILATPRAHFESVCEMLKGQRRVCFKGGLDSDFLTSWHIDRMRSLRISEVWTAWDMVGKKSAPRAIRRLSRVFGRNKTRAYTLIGFGGESLDTAEQRLLEVWRAGAIPFAQIWDGMANPSREWKRLARIFQRPAITKRYCKDRTEAKTNRPRRGEMRAGTASAPVPLGAK